jgi:phosphatidylglycerol---prolipoprotein diacylglyceryl transferase
VFPYIHIGPVTLGTYGLMVATALICAFFLMRADFRRRGIHADAESIIGITGLAGLAGARLYHLLEDPAAFFAHPLPLLFSTMGFAWFGALIGGFAALVLLARHYRMNILLLLDVASPAAALGYGIGRIGCLLSGDGDYGVATNLPWGMAFHPVKAGSRILNFISIDRGALVPSYGALVHGSPATAIVRVQPTPIYEFLVALGITYVLWRFGRRAIGGTQPAGEVFADYLILTGVARFLVEFIRINPRSFLGLTNAQAASILSVFAGVLLWTALARRAPAVQQSAGTAGRRARGTRTL